MGAVAARRGRTFALPGRARAVASRVPWTIVGLLALVGMSVLLRSQAIHARFWIDEGLSVGIADRPFTDIPGILRQDGAPPLYYLLLHVWMSFAGTGEGDTHALSLLFAVLCVPAGFWSGRTLFGRRAGWFAAVLLALSPYLTFYAQETRMYSLVALESLLVVTTFALVFVQRRRAWLPAFSGSLLALVLTHNWGLFAGVASVAALAKLVQLAPHGERRALLRDAAIAYGATALLYLPWLPTLLFQARHTGAPWAERPKLSDLVGGLGLTVGGQTTALAIAFVGGGSLAALLFGRPAAALLRDTVSAEGRRARAALAVLTIGLGGILVAFLASQASPAWANRYFAVFVPPILLAMAFGLSRAGRIGVVALAVVAVLWFDPRTGQLNAKGNAHTVGVLARDAVLPGDLVISTHPEQVPVLHYYFPPGLRWASALGPFPDTGVMDWRDALPRLRAAHPSQIAAPLLAATRPGQSVLLVQPIIRTGSWGAPWTMLVRRRAAQWERLLDHEPRLVRVGVLQQYGQRRPPRGVRAVRYRVR